MVEDEITYLIRKTRPTLLHLNECSQLPLLSYFKASLYHTQTQQDVYSRIEKNL